MRRELLIAAGPGEWRAAWLEDGISRELYVERGLSNPAGSIILGRVVRLAASLDAALVDIGEERPGFLPLRPPLRPEEGARLVVQIRREAQGGKGAYLTTRLHDPALAERAATHEPPVRLAPAPGLAAALALRLPALPDRVTTADAAPLLELRQVFPEAELSPVLPEEWPIDLDALFDAALSPTVALPGGGLIHIAETRAAVLIDVDSGTPETGSADRTALAANLAAVAAIARHIRLRQLGGGIVVDFAAAEGRALRDRIGAALAAALADDPARPQLLGWTRLGHCEIVRPRRGRPLGDILLDSRTGAKTGLTLAFEALRLLQRAARAQPAARWRVAVAPEVAAALRGPANAALTALETRLGHAFRIEAVAAAAAPAFDIAAV